MTKQIKRLSISVYKQVEEKDSGIKPVASLEVILNNFKEKKTKTPVFKTLFHTEIIVTFCNIYPIL